MKDLSPFVKNLSESLRRPGVCVCVHPWTKGLPTLFLIGRGQQGVHSSAANEDSCGYSVKQIGTPICVPAFENLSMAKAGQYVVSALSVFAIKELMQWQITLVVRELET